MEFKDLALVLRCVKALTRTGAQYLRLKLRTRDGEYEARVWEEVLEQVEVPAPGDMVEVWGMVEEYQGQKQLNVRGIRKCSPGECALEEFLPPPRRAPEEMLRDLTALVREIRDPYLRRLISSFLRDEEFLRDFMRIPASKEIHHARVGGLLEHTLSVTALAKKASDHYPVDRDLLLAGALLHDAGKVREIRMGPWFDYTTPGKLLGHIILGLEMVSEKIREIEGFPEERALLLKHMIASHHGRKEWGSPEVPRTPEAELLHRLDDLDAKMDGIFEWIIRGEGEWTEYHRAFERSFFRGPQSGPPEENEEGI